MKLKSALITAAALLASSACSAGEGTSGIDRNLHCAAKISAADQLIRQQELPKDDLIVDKGLLAMMVYLQTYAIPKDISEAQAFADLEVERDRLIAGQAPAKILAGARTCVEKARL